MKNSKRNKKPVSLTIVFHNCTINVDEKINNSKTHKKEQNGCTVNNK